MKNLRVQLVMVLALTVSAVAPTSAAGYGAQDVYLTSANAALNDDGCGATDTHVSPWQQSTIEPDTNGRECSVDGGYASVNAATNRSGMGGVAYSN
jgi:hypothetical protein